MLPNGVDSDALQTKLCQLEAMFARRWDDEARRGEERHLEIVRRLTAVEAQTTQTNGTVTELTIKEAVRTRLEQQAETFKVKYDREADKRGDRTRGWWMVVLASGLGFLGMATLAVVQVIQAGVG